MVVSFENEEQLLELWRADVRSGALTCDSMSYYKKIPAEDADASYDFQDARYLEHLVHYRSSLFNNRSNRSYSFGNHLVYCDTIGSTQTLLEGNYDVVSLLPSGMTVVAGHQMRGKGRHNLKWKSPKGCLMFSFTWRHQQASVCRDSVTPPVHMYSPSLLLYQYYAAIAMIYAIRSTPGYESLGIKMKWPNDIYYESDNGAMLKIGGVLVQSSSSLSALNSVADSLLTIGIGLNVDNCEPTFCLNQIVQRYNAQHNTRLPVWTRERLLAKFFVTFEALVKIFTSSSQSFTFFESLYQTYWMHNDQLVSVLVDEATGQREQAKIKGITQDGYLSAVSCVPETWILRLSRRLFPFGSYSPKTFVLQPYNNSLDIQTGLIKPKPKSTK